ncbi:hypothetical protein RZS08_63420, partial [Arthrospira platensis SPKY1]|nr:hypothetical protein [Arthrospira platensis SPKY1]
MQRQIDVLVLGFQVRQGLPQPSLKAGIGALLGAADRRPHFGAPGPNRVLPRMIRRQQRLGLAQIGGLWRELLGQGRQVLHGPHQCQRRLLALHRRHV